jgi:hypothetical protein
MTDQSGAASIWAYDVIVTRRADQFFLRVPELQLIVEGADLPTAAKALEESYRSTASRHEAVGASLPVPREMQVRRELLDKSLPFLLKAGAVAVAGVLLICAASIGIRYTLGEPLRHAAQRTAHAAVEQMTLGLEDAARRDLTPERRERLKQALRGIVPLVKPIIQELQPLFDDGGVKPAG